MLIARGKNKIFHYDFTFAGQRFKASTKTSSRTVAQRAEDERRREVEAGYNNVREVKRNRVRSLEDIISEYLDGYRVRYRSVTFDGPKEKPVLVLSNSIATTLNMWDGQVEELSKYFRVLRYDLRGHGATGVPAGCRSPRRSTAGSSVPSARPRRVWARCTCQMDSPTSSFSGRRNAPTRRPTPLSSFFSY